MKDPTPDVPQKAAWYRYTDASSIGIEIVVSIVGCALAAMWLENNVTHWSPWTTMVGLTVGLVVAGRALIRTSRNYHKAAAAEAAREGASTDPSQVVVDPPSDERAQP